MLVNVSAGTYVLDLGTGVAAMNTAKIYLQCQTSTGAINIILPRISTTPNWWFTVYINDVDDLAGTNPITVNINAADKIYGASSPVIFNQNGSSAVFEVVGQNAWTMNTAVGSYISSQYAGVYNVSDSSLTSLPPIPTNATSLTASNNLLTSIPTLSLLPSLRVLNVSTNLLTSLPSLSANTLMTLLSASYNNFVSFSNSFSGLVNLITISLSHNSLMTSFTSSIVGLTSLATLDLNTNALTTASVNAILADAVLAQPTITGAVSLDLSGGTNGAPSGQGIADKATLNGLGWTVTTN